VGDAVRKRDRITSPIDFVLEQGRDRRMDAAFAEIRTQQEQEGAREAEAVLSEYRIFGPPGT